MAAAEVISFYGTDGSGKSTIAREFSLAQESRPSLMLGGSSYASWLTPEIARMTLGSNHALAETPTGPIEKLRLYEDIAVACYGFARIMAEKGTEVVIDSDPYFKRLVWGTLGLPEADALEYIDHFEDRMKTGLGAGEGPDVIVGINMEEGALSHDELFARISARGANTEYDPTEIGELLALDAKVKDIWREISLGATGLSGVAGFNSRINGRSVLTALNPNCEPEQVVPNAQRIAAEIRSQI